jgi:hypothetical protein
MEMAAQKNKKREKKEERKISVSFKYKFFSHNFYRINVEDIKLSSKFCNDYLILIK